MNNAFLADLVVLCVKVHGGRVSMVLIHRETLSVTFRH